MNKSCVVSNIAYANVAINPSGPVPMSICVETEVEFRLRLMTIIKCEAESLLRTFGDQPVNWNNLDLKSSLVFPPFEGNKVFSYRGKGVINTYDMSMLKPALKAAKGKKLKDIHKAIEAFNGFSTLSFDDTHRVIIQYQGGLILTLKGKEKRLTWDNVDTLIFEGEETAEGVMTALEMYGETGEIDDAYTMFMLTPFDLHKSEMNLNQRGRLFAIDLGL